MPIFLEFEIVIFKFALIYQCRFCNNNNSKNLPRIWYCYRMRALLKHFKLNIFKNLVLITEGVEKNEGPKNTHKEIVDKKQLN